VSGKGYLINFQGGKNPGKVQEKNPETNWIKRKRFQSEEIFGYENL
jgi:hypothetical protein